MALAAPAEAALAGPLGPAVLAMAMETRANRAITGLGIFFPAKIRFLLMVTLSSAP